MQNDMFALFDAAECGNAQAEEMLSLELIDENELAAESVFCEEPMLSAGDKLLLPADISEQEWRGIADELLCTSIREAFGKSRGGAQYKIQSKAGQMAWKWISSNDPLNEEAYPFSFTNCCKAAGVDPEELREQLQFERVSKGLA